MMGELRLHNKTDIATVVKPVSPKIGDIVSAQFSQDDEWYRAKILQVFPDKKIEVFYIDYGNVRSFDVC
jgi:staphylococcal nuclease domain-containing protein 1